VARLIACSCSGYSTFQTNLLTIPSYVLFIIMNLSLAFTSKRVKERVGLSSLSSWWILIFLIVLITIPDNTNKWAKWAVLSLLQGYPVCTQYYYSTRHAVARHCTDPAVMAVTPRLTRRSTLTPFSCP
jgi:hypothetical protein